MNNFFLKSDIAFEIKSSYKHHKQYRDCYLYNDKFVNELTQIEEEQRALDARRAAIKKQVVERVKVMIRTYHLTTDDITVPAPGEQDDDGRMVKYRDADGNTWTGRGRKPKWLIAAINAGAKLDDFRTYADRSAEEL